MSEQTTSVEDHMVTVPICRTCGGWMVFCFAIRHKEYVCPKCETGIEFFHGNDRVNILKSVYDTFKEDSKAKLIEIGKRAGEYR